VPGRDGQFGAAELEAAHRSLQAGLRSSSHRHVGAIEVTDDQHLTVFEVIKQALEATTPEPEIASSITQYGATANPAARISVLDFRLSGPMYSPMAVG
jgi:hypothetical protein